MSDIHIQQLLGKILERTDRIPILEKQLDAVHDSVTDIKPRLHALERQHRFIVGTLVSVVLAGAGWVWTKFLGGDS